MTTEDGQEDAPLRATGEIETIFPTCAVPDYEDCIAKYVIDNQRLMTRDSISVFSGTLVGNATGLQHLTQRLNENKSIITAIGSFWGTVGESDVGTFSSIFTVYTDLSAFYAGEGPITWEGKIVVIEGTGMGGLEGICGGGTITGEYPPTFLTTYDLEFRFGKACNGNDD
ncbi:MAG: hypothetical protein ACE5NN_04615 [Candidatus Bathyarchaeia archaeon]